MPRPSKRIIVGSVGVIAWILPAVAVELPPGPNRDLVVRECQACHDLDNLVEAAGASREDWNSSIEAMTGFGLSVTAEDRERILEYLATALGPGSKRPAPR